MRRLLSVLAVVVLGVACGDSTGNNNDVLVRIVDDAFNPAQASVAAGGTVRWLWDGGANPHDVVWINPAGATNSQIQITGEYTRDFFLPGTYEYYCSVHGTPTSGMRGTVSVN